MTRLYSLLLLILAIPGCTDKTVDLLSFDNDYIIYGSGGGITGEVNETLLLEDGRIFARDINSDSLIYIGKCNSKKAARLIDSFTDFSDEEVNNPGNFYYYVERTMNDSDVVRLVWGNPSTPSNPELVAFWNELDNLTRSR